MVRRYTVDGPLGPLTLSAADGALCALDWGGGGIDGDNPLLARAADALAAYFAGRLTRFDLPLQPAGTAFQLGVWQAMAAIPCGSTVNYGVLAARLGSGPRAVAGACARNPIPILIPCHRVVAGTGPGGYSGGAGLATKQWLLAHERAVAS